MKTNDLINAIVADSAVKQRPFGQTLLIAALTGLVFAAAYFFTFVGARPGFVSLLQTSQHFALKFIFTLSLVGAAYMLVRYAMRPEVNLRSLLPLLIVPFTIIAAAMGFEVLQQPTDAISSTIMAGNWVACVTLIPILSVAPFVAIMYALRQGAPANPALAGAVGGLLSAAMGATLYASHCNQDSPLFVGVWYSLVIVAFVVIGALIGSRLLRW
jgi:hypothetical protein